MKFSIVLISAIIFSKLVLILNNKCKKERDTMGKIREIKPAEGIYLPVYIGLFVIALELGTSISIGTIFLIVVLFLFWLFFEGNSYFNPFLLFWGYRFYEVKSEVTTFIVITKQKDLKSVKEFTNLIRINNFTFLEY